MSMVATLTNAFDGNYNQIFKHGAFCSVLLSLWQGLADKCCESSHRNDVVCTGQTWVWKSQFSETQVSAVCSQDHEL